MRSTWTAIGIVTCAALFLATNEASADEKKIVVEGFESKRSSMSLQLNYSGLSLSQDGLTEDEVANLGGASFAWRWDPFEWGGLEVGFGSYGRYSDNDLIDEHRSALSLAWLWYFARHYHHRFYVATGLSFMSTDLEIGERRYGYSETGIALGLGSEWLVSKHWLVNTDVRMLLLEPNYTNDGEVEFREEGPTSAPDGSPREPHPTEWTHPPEDGRTGLMFNVGIGYRW